MPSVAQEDVQLMDRVASGDRDAFAEVFDRHSPVVLGMLIRLLRRRDLAEEVLQEAFLQAWEQAERYRPERASPKGWLLLLARSRALDRIRSATARGRREQAAYAEEGMSTVTAPEGTARLEASERKSRLVRALETLPADQRRCIELAFFEGLTHRQVAERTGDPLGTVKSRILLGMNKLRQALTAST